MTDQNQTASLLIENGLDEERVKAIIAPAFAGADDGELFIERQQSEVLAFDNGRLKAANFDTSQGFGLRSVCGEIVGYAHATEISEAALKRASEAVSNVSRGRTAEMAPAPLRRNSQLYGNENPIDSPSFGEKVALLQAIDTYARAKDSRVVQVSATLAASWQLIEILRPDGWRQQDIRPMTRLNVAIVSERDGRREAGSFGIGGRQGYATFIAEASWHEVVHQALRQALINLEAVPAPAGEFDVVLAAGWPGIMLHEAVGHGLEGDFNRKKTSAFSGLLGERVAAPGITIVDDGTIAQRRGSLTIDDEGTPTNCTTLIEDGILVGYMQDRQNARLMGMTATGNGRRESYAHAPMPRMTNTYMRAGTHEPNEIIASVKNGLYAVSFGGGQVDITSGKYVFQCTEAYKIENGRIGAPVKGAMLIGDGPNDLKRITMVGNDLALDRGIGTCGKAGQGVPVGVGQPTLKMEGITVGGTGS